MGHVHGGAEEAALLVCQLTPDLPDLFKSRIGGDQRRVSKSGREEGNALNDEYQTEDEAGQKLTQVK